MRTSCLLLVLILLLAPAAHADPLDGTWVMNPARTRYGHGAEARAEERLTCASTAARVTCVTQSVRATGRTVTARFSAAYDGRAYPVSGMPDVDTVVLTKVDDAVVDATFSRAGRAVFAYRGIRSPDGRSLTIIAVEPVTRRVLTSIVTYDRR